MQPSIMGLAVCVALFAAGYAARAPLIIGLVGSLAFGSTAVATLGSLGGSSPLIYTAFAGLLVAAVACRRGIWGDFGRAFGSLRPLWALSALMAYAVIGALLFPRMFAGHTSVFIQSSGRKGIVENLLGPVSGNVTQTGYFLIGAVTAITLAVLLLQRGGLDQVRRAFLFWCSLHVAMGLIDLAGKLTGAGDLLAPIRTANYAMLTEAEEAGFSRIAGAYSEASAFGGVSLACLAFCYVYWRRTGDRLALVLALLLVVLAALSTSSTAYVGLIVLSVPAAAGILRSAFAGRFAPGEIGVTAGFAAALAAALALSLAREGFFDPVLRLLDATVFSKVETASGKERTYWNVRSLQSFVDTYGLGVGLGSSRASSWPVAVISQLGLIGAVLTAALAATIVRGLGDLRAFATPGDAAVVAAVRAAALGSMLAGSMISGAADPGMIFMIAFGVIVAARGVARRRRRSVLAVAGPGRPRRPAPRGAAAAA